MVKYMQGATSQRGGGTCAPKKTITHEWVVTLLYTVRFVFTCVVSLFWRFVLVGFSLFISFALSVGPFFALYHQKKVIT